jgi:hypothetical protein
MDVNDLTNEHKWRDALLEFSTHFNISFQRNMSFHIVVYVALAFLGWCFLGKNPNLLTGVFGWNYRKLAKIPGPWTFAFTKWRLAYEDWKGTRSEKIKQLHDEYGPVVRIGPNELSFNSVSALKTIYGAGSGFERTDFYDMFDVYGKKNLFTFYSSKEHAERKKLLAHAYTKSIMLKGINAKLIQNKVFGYLQYLQKSECDIDEIFTSLHYFAIDAITAFLYGDWGSTKCLAGNADDRKLLLDIMDVSRRRLSWFMVHLTTFTKGLYSKTSFLSLFAKVWLPMAAPTTYSGIRVHALAAFFRFRVSAMAEELPTTVCSIIERLWKSHGTQRATGLDDLELASEVADHLLAGIDTTSDSLLFLIWALSRPQNAHFQQQLINELNTMKEDDLDTNQIPTVEACDKLKFLDAVIKETLRLYAPLPASEPRLCREDTAIDGYQIPAYTIVSMSPYSLHRNEAVFESPLVFDPNRWMTAESKQIEMKRWWWAFSSGARMCIGLQYVLQSPLTRFLFAPNN